MLRRSPLKRSAWTVSAAPDPDRVRSVPAVAPGAFRVAQPVGGWQAAAQPKPAVLRSEAYRRAVASLPCIVCGIEGWSQAAHGSGAGTGQAKGMGLKSCDTTCFPACADRPGVRGHHSLLDQGALYDREERHALERAWAHQTQRNVVAMGKWPEHFPAPPVLVVQVSPAEGSIDGGFDDWF